jgi:hypothetical protein
MRIFFHPLGLGHKKVPAFDRDSLCCFSFLSLSIQQKHSRSIGKIEVKIKPEISFGVKHETKVRLTR